MRPNNSCKRLLRQEIVLTLYSRQEELHLVLGATEDEAGQQGVQLGDDAVLLLLPEDVRLGGARVGAHDAAGTDEVMCNKGGFSLRFMLISMHRRYEKLKQCVSRTTSMFELLDFS